MGWRQDLVLQEEGNDKTQAECVGLVKMASIYKHYNWGRTIYLYGLSKHSRKHVKTVA